MNKEDFNQTTRLRKLSCVKVGRTSEGTFAHFVALVYDSEGSSLLVQRSCIRNLLWRNFHPCTAYLSAFRTFVRFALVWFCLFPLPLGVREELQLVIVTYPGLFSYLLCIEPYHILSNIVLKN